MTMPTEPRADDPGALVETITDEQLAEWEREHVRRGEYGSVLGVPICDVEVDEDGTYSVHWPCPVSLLIPEIRKLRSELAALRPVVEAAVTAVTTWRSMHDDESRGVDHWWDSYVVHRDALVEAADAYAAREGSHE